MFSTVRKSISYTLVVAQLTALSVAWSISIAQPGLAQKVKKLDDNSEVLRPIPAVLKPATPQVPAPQAKAAASGKPTEAAKKAEPDKKASADSGKTKKVLHSSGLGAHFVPPPPPITPSMMGDSADYALYGSMPVEMMGKEALKDRAKEIGIQYKDAAQELADRSREKDEKIQRAKEFEGLFQEGVVSKRELEASKREAGTVNSDIDRLTVKANELKNLLDRINKRLASRSNVQTIAASKSGSRSQGRVSRRKALAKPVAKSEAKPDAKAVAKTEAKAAPKADQTAAAAKLQESATTRAVDSK